MVPAKFLQNLEYDDKINDDFEDDWKTVAWWKNKCTVLKLKDKDLTWNTEREDNVLVTFLYLDPQSVLRFAQEHTLWQ